MTDFDRALPIAYLGDLFNRDAKTHELIWRSAPRGAFKSDRDWRGGTGDIAISQFSALPAAYASNWSGTTNRTNGRSST
jgi:hypothetical protein